MEETYYYKQNTLKTYSYTEIKLLIFSIIILNNNNKAHGLALVKAATVQSLRLLNLQNKL